MTEYRCPECGIGIVKPTARLGRTASYRHFDGLLVPEDLEIPTCDACGEEFVNRAVVRKIDEALEPQYRERMRLLAVDAIEAMVREGVQQYFVERQLGIAQGYLSKIKSADRVPSAELSLHLASIGLDPEARLREIEHLTRDGFAAAKARYDAEKNGGGLHAVLAMIEQLGWTHARETVQRGVPRVEFHPDTIERVYQAILDMQGQIEVSKKADTGPPLVGQKLGLAA